jgi:transposase
MAAIVFQTDKRSGITYAYESHSYWDKEKKQSRAKRKLIGRVDKTTGKIVPTDGRCRKKKNKLVTEDNNNINTLPIQNVKRRFYGATYLLDAIGDKLGITDKLKKCFPDSYKQILSIVYYLILEENSALFRFEKWSLLHKHPYDDNISSQRISELFASIDEYSKHKFFKLWGKHKVENEFWAYDITSISSYSEQLKQIQYGYNKENDNLAQLNLAVVFGSSSNLPFYYRKLSGNIPDVKTVCNLLEELKMLDFSKIKLVMDRGFFSSANVNELYRHHLKFLLSARMSLKFVQKTLDGIYDTFRSFENYNSEYELYTHTVTTTWDYKHKRPYKKDIVKEKKRIYVL